MEITEFREVDRTNWNDFVKLFESPGGPSYCWCMAWRPLEGDRNKISNATRKKSMNATVKAGTPVGILAYEGKKPVAWCSIAPRATHRPLGGEEYPGVDEDEIWSLVCFYVPRAMRGQGVMTALLQEAIRVARKHGAKVVEAYPVDPESPSYRFMGFVKNFKKTGFKETGMAGTRRHVMHLKLKNA
jgi:GNAT superfamily N-acetyltransferase